MFNPPILLDMFDCADVILRADGYISVFFHVKYVFGLPYDLTATQKDSTSIYLI